MGMHIVVKGNPVDGFTFFGPYKTHEHAMSAGDSVDTEWWAAPLEAPEDFE